VVIKLHNHKLNTPPENDLVTDSGLLISSMDIYTHNMDHFSAQLTDRPSRHAERVRRVQGTGFAKLNAYGAPDAQIKYLHG
jgi:hypothetical protein